MRRWRRGGQWRSCHGLLDDVELGLVLDREQRDLWAAAGPALERTTVERRLVAFRRPHEAERNGAAVPVRAYRQQRQAAATAGDRTRCVSRDLDHVGHANHRAAPGPQTMAQRLPAKSPASMASIGPKPQDVETPISTRARGQLEGGGKESGHVIYEPNCGRAPARTFRPGEDQRQAGPEK